MTTTTLLLLLASSGTLVTTPNPIQIPKDAEYEIVLNAEHVVFNTLWYPKQAAIILQQLAPESLPNSPPQ